MAQNLVVQLLLKTGTFSTDLKQAKGQIQNFQKGCETAGKSISGFGSALGLNVGSLTKFGGAVGAAVLAGKAFKEVIEGSQTTSDFFSNAIYTAKNSVKELASAVSTFDFSNFNNGLSDIIRKGYEAAAAIDQLGNTILSYNIASAETNSKLKRARAILYDPTSTKEEKEQAKKDMKEALDELKGYSSVLLDDYENTMIAEVNARGGHLTGQGALALIDEILKIDTTKGREAFKEKAKNDYDAYLTALNTLNRENTTYTTMPSTAGAVTMSKLNRTPEYEAELSALNKQYEKAITYNVLLEKYSFEELDNLGKQRIAMININDQIADMEFMMERIGRKAGNQVNKTLNDEVDIQDKSLSYWKKLSQEAQKHRDAEVFNSEEWNKYNNALEFAIQKIDELTLKTEVLKKKKFIEDNPLLPIDSNFASKGAEIQDNYDIFGNVIIKPKTKEELQHVIKIYEDGLSKLKEGDPLIERYKAQIKSLQDRLRAFDVSDVKIPEIKEQTINTWDEFNSAMSATSTIVNALGNTFKENSELTAASILQMVATTLPAIGTLMSSISALTAVEAVEAGVGAVGKAVSSSQHWIEAIAAVAALGAAVAAALASAKSQASKFAGGGIVGGSSFTGDRVSANVNSGEMILNRSQQTRLFRMANGGGNGGGEVTFHISGTELVGVLQNQTRKNKIIG